MRVRSHHAAHLVLPALALPPVVIPCQERRVRADRVLLPKDGDHRLPLGVGQPAPAFQRAQPGDNALAPRHVNVVHAGARDIDLNSLGRIRLPIIHATTSLAPAPTRTATLNGAWAARRSSLRDVRRDTHTDSASAAAVWKLRRISRRW